MAVATLTYVYADSMAVIGALSLQAEPGQYDLCRQHAQSLSVPRGWEVIRLPDSNHREPAPCDDDLLALADAVREIGLRDERPPAEPSASIVVLAERRHLRMIRDADPD